MILSLEYNIMSRISWLENLQPLKFVASKQFTVSLILQSNLTCCHGSEIDLWTRLTYPLNGSG